jgi:hypothetical protein
VIVCVFAYVLVGHRGIYGAQRLRVDKVGFRLTAPLPLRELGRLPSGLPEAASVATSTGSAKPSA